MSMKKRGLLLFIVFLIIFPLVIAEELPANVILTLNDISTNEQIDSVLVSVNIGGNIVTQLVEEDDVLRLNLPDNMTYLAEFKVDDITSDGKDFFGKDNLKVENNLIKGIFLYPVGSVRGIVKDNLDNIVGNANLKFECSGQDLVDLPEKADGFGSFSVDYLPTGSCKIFASYEGGIGIEEVTIERGSLNDIEVMLDKSIVVEQENRSYSMFIIFIFVFVLALIVYIFRKQLSKLAKKEKKLEKLEKKEESEINELKADLELGKRARDILGTLSERQKKIVEFIIEHKGSITQSKIFHGTGIPKASLSRNLKSLEIKKIIKIEKLGKLRKIKLSDWFLKE